MNQPYVACWRILSGCTHDPTQRAVQARVARWMRHAPGEAAWATLHGCLVRRLPSFTAGDLEAVAHSVQAVLGGKAAEGVIARACVIMIVREAHRRVGATGRPPPAVYIQCLCSLRQPKMPLLPRALLKWVLDGLKWAGAPGKHPSRFTYGAATVRQLLGLALSTRPELVSGMAAVQVLALASANALGACSTTEILARAVLHATALGSHRLSARQTIRSRSRRVLECLGTPVQAHVGALTSQRALDAVPACIVCTATAAEDRPGKEWLVLPCACMMHADCFERWVSANPSFWDRTLCLRCKGNIAELVLRTLQAQG